MTSLFFPLFSCFFSLSNRIAIPMSNDMARALRSISVQYRTQLHPFSHFSPFLSYQLPSVLWILDTPVLLVELKCCAYVWEDIKIRKFESKSNFHIAGAYPAFFRPYEWISCIEVFRIWTIVLWYRCISFSWFNFCFPIRRRNRN